MKRSFQGLNENPVSKNLLVSLSQSHEKGQNVCIQIKHKTRGIPIQGMTLSSGHCLLSHIQKGVQKQISKIKIKKGEKPLDSSWQLSGSKKRDFDKSQNFETKSGKKDQNSRVDQKRRPQSQVPKWFTRQKSLWVINSDSKSDQK